MDFESYSISKPFPLPFLDMLIDWELDNTDIINHYICVLPNTHLLFYLPTCLTYPLYDPIIKVKSNVLNVSHFLPMSVTVKLLNLGQHDKTQSGSSFYFIISRARSWWNYIMSHKDNQITRFWIFLRLAAYYQCGCSMNIVSWQFCWVFFFDNAHLFHTSARMRSIQNICWTGRVIMQFLTNFRLYKFVMNNVPVSPCW